MRNFSSAYRKSPRAKRTQGVGFTFPFVKLGHHEPAEASLAADRHFTPVAVPAHTPSRVFVDLDPYGEREEVHKREIFDARD